MPVILHQSTQIISLIFVKIYIGAVILITKTLMITIKILDTQHSDAGMLVATVLLLK
jgi:hypothetical protein